MDSLLMAMIAMTGVVSYFLVTVGRPTTLGLALFSWVIGIPVLSIYVFRQIEQTDSTSLMVWSGTAQMGPLTAILTALGLTIFFCGGKSWTKRSMRESIPS